MNCCGGGNHHWTEEEHVPPESAPLSPAVNSVKVHGVNNGDGTDLAAAVAADAINIHPWDSSINLSVHQPLYPPGKIIHLVRHYPKVEA